jgi:hypothetical protein
MSWPFFSLKNDAFIEPFDTTFQPTFLAATLFSQFLISHAPAFADSYRSHTAIFLLSRLRHCRRQIAIAPRREARYAASIAATADCRQFDARRHIAPPLMRRRQLCARLYVTPTVSSTALQPLPQLIAAFQLATIAYFSLQCFRQKSCQIRFAIIAYASAAIRYFPASTAISLRRRLRCR